MKQQVETQQVIGFVFGLAFWWFLLGNIQAAVGVIALVFVHEMGHFIAARLRGIPVAMPVFTPFGAYVQTGQSNSIEDEVFVKMAGPLVGGLAALVVLAFGHVLASSVMVQVGTVGVFLNLFNLIPLDPFDGGGIAQIFGRWTVVPGVLAFAYFFLIVGRGNPMSLVFGAFLGYQAFQLYQRRTMQWQQVPDYFRSSPAARAVTALTYLATGGILTWVLLHPGFIPALLAHLGR